MTGWRGATLLLLLGAATSFMSWRRENRNASGDVER